MPTLEEVRRRVETAEGLQAVVKVMKTLSAVSIRHYEKAVESLAEYNRTVELGLQIVLKRGVEEAMPPKSEGSHRLGAIIYGSDQGMCGPFNVQVASYAMETMDHLGIERENRTILAVGQRMIAPLEDAGQPVAERLPVPTSSAGITSMIQRILMKIEAWRLRGELDRAMLFYNGYAGSSYRPYGQRLLPIDLDGFQGLQSQAWPSRVLPTFTMEWTRLFSALVRQYLFVSLYRAFAESLASENSSRLRAMQSAEENIEERLEELSAQFRHERQSAITGELLDIVSGFEALTQGKSDGPRVRG